METENDLARTLDAVSDRNMERLDGIRQRKSAG